MTAPVVVGVDPGGHDVGLVVRQGDELLDWALLTIDRCEPRAHAVGIAVAAVEGIWPKLPEWASVAPLGQPLPRPDVLLAVEDIKAPGGFAHGERHPIGMTGILDTAVLVGALLARWPDLILVPPGGNGSGPLSAYPQELRPTRGSGKGKDRLRHTRSAWDVAGAAVTLARFENVFQGGAR